MSAEAKKIITEIMDTRSLDRTFARLAHEIIERNRGVEHLVFVGLQTRGAPIAKRLLSKIKDIEGIDVPLGILDVTLHRDDYSMRHEALKMQSTHIPFNLDGKVVVLVDDVLYTGRTVRAALDALMDFGRPSRIELAVMVDRGHRELPIRADYIGKNLLTSLGEEVAVKLQDIDGVDGIYLVASNRDK